MSDTAIRELILLAEIFGPGMQDRGYGAGLIMKKVPALLEWNIDAIQAELQEMQQNGLVLPFSEASSSWKSTPKGRAAREAIARGHFERARCLCSPKAHALDDILLAIAATAEICGIEHSYAPTEVQLADYLFDFKDELQAALLRLEERGWVNLRRALSIARSRSLYTKPAQLVLLPVSVLQQ
jgi:hypothetical protein